MKWFYGAILGLSLFSGIAQANDVPKLTGRIVDPGNMITEKTKATVRTKIEELEKGDYPVYFVALVYDQKLDEPIEEFSLKVARSWGIGKVGVDNGVLLIIAPKDSTTRMEVGYRLEGMLTDSATKTMQQNIVPLLRERKYGGSINGIIDQIKPLIAKEASTVPIAFSNRDASYEEKQRGSGMGLLVFMVAILGLLFILGRVAIKRIRKNREAFSEMQNIARIKRETRQQAEQVANASKAKEEEFRRKARESLQRKTDPIPVMDMEFPAEPSNVKRHPPAVEPKRYEPNRYSSKAVPLNTERPKYDSKPLNLTTKPPITPAPPMRPTVKKQETVWGSQRANQQSEGRVVRKQDDDSDSGIGSALLGGIAGAVIGSALSGGSSRSSDNGYGSGSSRGSDDTPSYKGGGGDFGGGGSSNTYDSPSDSGGDGGGGGGGAD